MYKLLQEGKKHKPSGPWWSGQDWTTEDKAKVYPELETAAAVAQARKTANHNVLLLEIATNLYTRLKVRGRGQLRH